LSIIGVLVPGHRFSGYGLEQIRLRFFHAFLLFMVMPY
jgi:hypothetical protein